MTPNGKLSLTKPNELIICGEKKRQKSKKNQIKQDKKTRQILKNSPCDFKKKWVWSLLFFFLKDNPCSLIFFMGYPYLKVRRFSPLRSNICEVSGVRSKLVFAFMSLHLTNSQNNFYSKNLEVFFAFFFLINCFSVFKGSIIHFIRSI